MAQRLQEQGVALMGGRRVVGMEPKEEQDGEKDTAHGQGRAGSSGYRSVKAHTCAGRSKCIAGGVIGCTTHALGKRGALADAVKG